jgi:hypothetical protein
MGPALMLKSAGYHSLLTNQESPQASGKYSKSSRSSLMKDNRISIDSHLSLEATWTTRPTPLSEDISTWVQGSSASPTGAGSGPASAQASRTRADSTLVLRAAVLLIKLLWSMRKSIMNSSSSSKSSSKSHQIAMTLALCYRSTLKCNRWNFSKSSSSNLHLWFRSLSHRVIIRDSLNKFISKERILIFRR